MFGQVEPESEGSDMEEEIDESENFDYIQQLVASTSIQIVEPPPITDTEALEEIVESSVISEE